MNLADELVQECFPYLRADLRRVRVEHVQIVMDAYHRRYRGIDDTAVLVAAALEEVGMPAAAQVVRETFWTPAQHGREEHLADPGQALVDAATVTAPMAVVLQLVNAACHARPSVRA